MLQAHFIAKSVDRHFDGNYVRDLFNKFYEEDITMNNSIFGVDLFGNAIQPNGVGELRRRFIMAPFSVLSARDGFWQERKTAWLSLGLQSDLGRENLACTVAGGWINKGPDSGGSIFDPVLAEISYNWFCPKGGQVIDPFAGGSVRGVVAAISGYKYWGCDIRPEQVAANIQQGADLCAGVDYQPRWVCGDSIDEVPSAPEADFIFSCPPYGDLETYSNLSGDISGMEYHTFLAAYKRIIMRSCAKLRDNRFAAFVVGDFRDQRGFMRNFISDTIGAFREQGLHLYNECIYVTPCGSLPVRTSAQFDVSRKIGKTHQNLLVFVKGDPKVATKLITDGPVIGA